MKLHIGCVKAKVLLHIGCVMVILIGEFLLGPTAALARITPEDIMKSKREVYEQKVSSYSPQNKEKLEALAKKVAQVNKNRTDELDRTMTVQAQILDEYELRVGESRKDGIEKARYWITYAHEAVAYQAAKIYIFNLTSEGNMKNDALSTISVLQSELGATKNKVVYSQNILKNLMR